MAKVSINKDLCIGCWMCVATCWNIFQFQDNTKPDVIKQPETEQETKCCKEAEENCPVWAIKVEE